MTFIQILSFINFYNRKCWAFQSYFWIRNTVILYNFFVLTTKDILNSKCQTFYSNTIYPYSLIVKVIFSVLISSNYSKLFQWIPIKIAVGISKITVTCWNMDETMQESCTLMKENMTIDRKSI